MSAGHGRPIRDLRRPIGQSVNIQDPYRPANSENAAIQTTPEVTISSIPKLGVNGAATRNIAAKVINA
ncbi:MAG: hypothetical protein A49_16630 [Methyloceanibacter sp.]|nr:MAG: hypothetical protein A49_16630 [Methyloceanibacter sp.]